MAELVPVISAIITGGLTLVGVIIANNKSRALTDYKIEELTREVREHNHFAKRMPVVEEQIKVINHRLEDLEKK
jgi:hypothetical protein